MTMPDTSNVAFWGNLFDLTKKIFQKIDAENNAFISRSVARITPVADVNFNDELALLNAISAQNYKCKNAQAYEAYLQSVEDAAGQYSISAVLRARILCQIEAIKKSLLEATAITTSVRSSAARSTTTNLLQEWEGALVKNSTETARRALKAIVSKSSSAIAVNQSVDNTLFTDAYVKNRSLIKTKRVTLFTEHDGVIAQKYISMVSGTWHFDQALDALKRAADLFLSKEKTKKTPALEQLFTIIDELDQAAASSSVEFCNNLYKSKRDEIERHLSVLYNLPLTSNSLAFSTAVHSQYAWWPRIFASKERQALEQYVAANPAIIHSEAEKTQAKADFDKAFARSKASIAIKRDFHHALMGIENHSSSEMISIVKKADDIYRKDILNAINACYSGEVSAEPTSSNILKKVKAACSWSVSAWWSGEYKKTEALLKALDDVPVDKEKIKKLSAILLAVHADKKVPPGSEVLATLDASAKSTWGEDLIVAMKRQEKQAKQKNKQIVHAKEVYSIQAGNGYPTAIAETRSDCDYFISEIFSTLKSNSIKFKDEALLSVDEEINLLLEKLRAIYKIANQNQYFVLTLLSLELASNRTAVYQEPLKKLLLILLGKRDENYADALAELKSACPTRAALINYLPKALDLSDVLQDDKDTIYEALNAIVPFVVLPPPVSVARTPNSPSVISSVRSVTSASNTKKALNKKSGLEIDSMSKEELFAYAESCATEVVATSYKRVTGSGYKEKISLLLEANFQSCSAKYPKSILLAYTLWQWYKEKTGNGDEIFRKHRTYAEDWINVIITPANAFISSLEEAMKSGKNLGNTFFALPEKHSEGYRYAGESLQKLVNITKAILPHNCDPDVRAESTIDTSSCGRSGSEHSEISLSGSRATFYGHPSNDSDVPLFAAQGVSLK